MSVKSRLADMLTDAAVMCPTGSMWRDGRISVGQCDLVESWDNLSLSQKKNLNYRYQIGCECKVSDAPTRSSPSLWDASWNSHLWRLKLFFFPFVTDGLMRLQPKPVITLIRSARAPLLRSTPVTQCRVCPLERMSACGLTGCWITAWTASRLDSTLASAAPTRPAAGTVGDPRLRKTSWTWPTLDLQFEYPS